MVRCHVLCLYEVGSYVANLEPLEERHQAEIDRDFGTKYNAFAWRAKGILDLVRPDIVHRLSHCQY